MVRACPTCDCTRIIVDDDSQSLCCTECGLLFDIATADEPKTIEEATQPIDNSTFTEPVNQSNCTSVPHLLKSRYVPGIDLFKNHFDTTDEETEFVMKLCREYLYHPLHLYCRYPMEVIICLFYLVVLQHRDSGARLLSDYCQQFEANPRRCLRIYTAMRLILADQFVTCPSWYDPVHHLESIMTFVYPTLIAHSTSFFSIHTDVRSKRKHPEIESSPITWPSTMDRRSVRSQTAELVGLAKEHGFADGRHHRPFALICLVISLLAHYYRYNPHVRTRIHIHWTALATLCSFHDGHRTLQKRYQEILHFLHDFATCLPWLKHLEKGRDTLMHLDDILTLKGHAPVSHPPAYQRALLHRQHRRVQLQQLHDGDPNQDPEVSHWLAQVVQSGQWTTEAIISMSDPELASHAHRLSRPLDFSHDLDRPELDINDLSLEEQAAYLV